MKKLALVPILAFAFAACADQPNPLAVDSASLNLQTTLVSDYIWFNTTPPDPALVGGTYEVSAESSESAGTISTGLWSETPSVCSVSNKRYDGFRVDATVTFEAVGNCLLVASTDEWTLVPWQDSQQFDITTRQAAGPGNAGNRPAR
jgi:hypothetical protein